MTLTLVRVVSTADVLDRAAYVLEEWGWSRKYASPSRRKVRKGVRLDRVCLIGSIVQARADLGLPYRWMPADELAALGFARTRTGLIQGNNACEWNEHADARTVIARLRTTATARREAPRKPKPPSPRPGPPTLRAA